MKDDKELMDRIKKGESLSSKDLKKSDNSSCLKTVNEGYTFLKYESEENEKKD